MLFPDARFHGNICTRGRCLSKAFEGATVVHRYLIITDETPDPTSHPSHRRSLLPAKPGQPPNAIIRHELILFTDVGFIYVW